MSDDAPTTTGLGFEQLPRAGATPAPRNPYVTTLVVVDLVFLTGALVFWLAGTALASQNGGGDVQFGLALGSLGWAGLVALLLVAVAAVRWRPPSR